MIIRQKLGILHVLIYHLRDIGHRTLMEDQNENKNDENGKQKFINMRNRLKEKRQKFNRIRNVNLSDQKEQKNKFVTEIMPTHVQNNKNQKHSFLEYSFGYSFFYHKFYEKNENKNQRILGGINKKFEDANNFRDAPKSYSFKDWFISPKYKSMREEVVDNNYLTLEQFKKETKKASININSLHGKNMTANAFFELIYEIKEGLNICINHMLSVLLS
eukprot:106735_1